jgi:NH3-dependent NAD+ synthetase
MTGGEPRPLTIDPAGAAEEIEAFLKRQASALRRDGVLLGVRGGIDSAVVATLAARALGLDAVLALLPGITDEYALGLTYELPDQILWALEQGLEPQDIAGELQIELAQVAYVGELVRHSAHMRELPPVPAL